MSSSWIDMYLRFCISYALFEWIRNICWLCFECHPSCHLQCHPVSVYSGWFDSKQDPFSDSKQPHWYFCLSVVNLKISDRHYATIPLFPMVAQGCPRLPMVHLEISDRHYTAIPLFPVVAQGYPRLPKVNLKISDRHYTAIPLFPVVSYLWFPKVPESSPS